MCREGDGTGEQEGVHRKNYEGRGFRHRKAFIRAFRKNIYSKLVVGY